MKNDILIFGGGFIGARLREEFGWPVTQSRIVSFQDAEEELKRYSPRIIINCLGFTGGSNVDGCEMDKDKTLSSNVFVPVILAEAALRRKIKLVHISSGCIYHFDYTRDGPISEEKEPDFFELFYSRSKIYAEKALLALADKCDILIARIRIPLDDRPHPKNILDKLLSYKKVIDVENSVTYIPDFVRALRHLIKIKARGLYNVVNKGGLRYPELMEVYRRAVPDFTYEIIDYQKLNLTRTNLILSTQKLEKSGFVVRDIREVLKECAQNYLKIKDAGRY